MLNIKNLTKVYGDKKAVDDLTLHINPGEIYGFIGHNGAGKTTTIKCCCGILQFDEGEILIDGISVKNKPLEAKKKIAYIPDNPDLYDFMTGIQFLNFVADIFGVTADERQNRIRKYAEMFELTDNLAQPVSAYSHGMKQKVVMSSALVHDPKVVFMDEPTVGLDPRSAKMVKDILKGLADHGVTVYLTTHILEIAERMCDRVGIIQKGRLLAVGTMEELRHQTEIQTGDSNTEAKSLEDLFLELTGGSEYDEVSRFLED